MRVDAAALKSEQQKKKSERVMAGDEASGQAALKPSSLIDGFYDAYVLKLRTRTTDGEWE
jgi:hypothetical protein